MVNGNGRAIWLRILSGLIPLAVLGFVALIALKADVRHLEDAVSTKANRETVDAQYQAILRELQSLRQLIERRP